MSEITLDPTVTAKEARLAIGGELDLASAGEAQAALALLEASRIDDHQHRLDPGFPAVAATHPLRGDEGRDGHLHEGAGTGADREGHPRQRRGAGPGWTPLIAMSFPAEHVAHFGESDPMGRPAQPAELAPVYVFLASDESRLVVGEVIRATGGRLLPS